MSYYVYATFTERERLKFKTKEEALAFSQWANKEIHTSFDWTFKKPSPYEAREYGVDLDKLGEKQGFWEHVNHNYRASQCKFISKPIKSEPLHTLILVNFLFILSLNFSNNSSAII